MASAAVLQCVLIYLLTAEAGFYFKDVFFSSVQFSSVQSAVYSQFVTAHPEKQVRMGLYSKDEL